MQADTENLNYNVLALGMLVEQMPAVKMFIEDMNYLATTSLDTVYKNYYQVFMHDEVTPPQESDDSIKLKSNSTN